MQNLNLVLYEGNSRPLCSAYTQALSVYLLFLCRWLRDARLAPYFLFVIFAKYMRGCDTARSKRIRVSGGIWDEWGMNMIKIMWTLGGKRRAEALRNGAIMWFAMESVCGI
jgi:hypothetical protein